MNLDGDREGTPAASEHEAEFQMLAKQVGALLHNYVAAEGADSIARTIRVEDLLQWLTSETRAYRDHRVRLN